MDARMRMRGAPLPLRDYQKAAAEAAVDRNLLCVLPTNAGKTIIAASVIETALLRENDAIGQQRKVIFLAPTRSLAHQQADVLMDQIGLLKHVDEHEDSKDSRWKLALFVGDKYGDGARTQLRHVQIAVMTPAIFENHLNRGFIRMAEVALLVIDEAHHCRGKEKKDQYTMIMKYHYQPCSEECRPRTLALTASPVENAQGTVPDEKVFWKSLEELEDVLDASAWSCEVKEEWCPHALPVVLPHEKSEASKSEAASFVEEAMQRACPPLEEACALLGSREDAEKLVGAWMACWEKKMLKLGEELGAWAFDRAARIFVQDLDRGTRQLRTSWYESDETDGNRERERDGKDAVGGTSAHAQLLRHARQRLKVELDGREVTRPAAETDKPESSLEPNPSKVQALLSHLRERQPRKCLIFVQQRVSCRLLAELLQTELEQQSWPTDWICRGIDVTECDAVIDFDGATTSRQFQQRGGRARAKNASYAHLLCRGSTDAQGYDDHGYRNLQEWNQMCTGLLAHARRPPPQAISSAKARAMIRDRCVRTNDANGKECAVLPIERCKPLLTEVYVLPWLEVRRGDQEFEQDLTADGTHFTAKPKGAHNYRMTEAKSQLGAQPPQFICELHLPGVLLCSADVGSELPVTLPPTNEEPSKDKAIQQASLEGVRWLFQNSVLDEHLRVRGRSAELQRIREEAGRGRRRVSTRAGRYWLHVKEGVLRSLPRLLREPPTTDVSGRLTVWAHPLKIEDSDCRMALLLRGRCPVRELLVGPEQHRQRFKLGEGFELRLEAEQVQLITRWLVGSLDLVQAGNAGEPLHQQLRAHSQLISFSDHTKGTFTPAPIAFGDSPPSTAAAQGANESLASTDPCKEAAHTFGHAWRCKAPLVPYTALVRQLAESIKEVVARIAAASGLPAGGAEAAVVVTVDLDHTLWAGTCLDWPEFTFRKLDAQSPSSASSTGIPRRQVIDPSSGEILELHAEIPVIFDALQLAAIPVAIASASPAAGSARALLREFGLMDGQRSYPIEMGESEEKREGKKVHHLENLAKRLGVAVDRLFLFDDEPANVDKVREVLECSAMLIDPVVGLTAESLLRGLEHRCSELRLRAQNLEVESREPNKDSRRKLKQQGADAIAKGQADVDQGRVHSRLAALSVEPAWWLAAPTSASGAEVDWELIRHATDLYGTCRWPRLENLDHPLVATSVPAEDDELQPGPVPLCALATYESERNARHNLLLNLTVDDDGTVSGNVRTRRVNVAATAAKRIVQADGTFRTQDTERAGGYKPRNVQLLPLHSLQYMALRGSKRLLWRLEHLLSISEADVTSLLRMPSVTAGGQILPSAPVVPLELISAALTHPGANAEAVHNELTPTKGLNRFRHDEHGCCEWDAAEWLGDALLRFYSVTHVLVAHDGGGSFAQLSPAAEQILRNSNLHRQAKRLDIPALTLCAPFVSSASLPKLRKQVCSVKDQADPMESLLGVIALAAIDATPHEPPLGTALHSGFGFFRTAILPPPPQDAAVHMPDPSSSSCSELVAKLVRRFELCTDPTQALGAEMRAHSLAVMMSKTCDVHIRFERVQKMLQEVCQWNSGAVFERAEFLGDAFLQAAVSLELARRYPEKTAGDQTAMRSALVNNLHLGRLLTRRVGVELALSFFECEGGALHQKPTKLAAIRDFILCVPPADKPLDVIEALEEMRRADADGDKARVKVQADIAAQVIKDSGSAEDASVGDQERQPVAPYDRRGEDYRKPVGDQYEAIVGLVFCALEGDLDKTWRCFVSDLFPSSELEADKGGEEKVVEESGFGALELALQETRKADFRKEISKLITDPDPTLGLDPDATPTAAPTAAPTAVLDPNSAPIAVAASSTAAASAAAPQALPMDLETPALETKHVRDPSEPSDLHVQKRCKMSVDGTDAGLIVVGTGGGGTDGGGSSSGSGGGGSNNSIGGGASGSSSGNGSVCGTTSASQAGGVASPQDNAVTVANQMMQKAHKVAASFLIETYMGNRPFSCELRHGATSELLGESVGCLTKIKGDQSAKKAAYADMLQRGRFAELLQTTSASQLALVPQPQPPQKSVQEVASKQALSADVEALADLASGLVRCHPLEMVLGDASSHASPGVDAIIAPLKEVDEHFRKKIRGLLSAVAVETSTPVLEGLVHKACKLANRPRPRPPETDRSGGRLFHDTLLTYLKEPKERDRAPTPQIGDTVRICNLKGAVEHNGTYGEVISWMEKTQRFGVSTSLRPDGLSVCERNMELIRLGPGRMSELNDCARQLTHYLQEAENDDFDWPILKAHGLELPLYFFNSYHKLRGLLDTMGQLASPQSRLLVLQQAVRGAPTLSLCGPYGDRVRRRCDVEDAKTFDGQLTECLADEMEHDSMFDAMRIAASGEVTVVQLPRRLDYLYAITELLHILSGDIGGPLGMYARYAGQKTEQPALYFLISQPSTASRRNQLASHIAGFDIFDDAILANVELKPPMREELCCGGIAACERFLSRHKTDPLEYMLGDAGRPLLGNWMLPRLSAWPKTRPPKSLMEAWLESRQAFAMANGECVEVSSWGTARFTNEDGSPAPNSRFVGTVRTNAWRIGLCTQPPPPPPLAHQLDDGSVELVGQDRTRKKDAENDALLILMRTMSNDEPTPPFRIIGPLELHGGVDGGVAFPGESVTAAGSTVRCSYTLSLESGMILEEQLELDVTIGAGMLHQEVEELLAEAAGEWLAADERRAGPSAFGSEGVSPPMTSEVPMQASYRGAEVRCLLRLTVHSVRRNREESEYELTGESGGGPSLAALRMQKLLQIVQQLQPTSLADIGCGEGRLLQSLLEGGAAPVSLTHLIGTDVFAKALRVAGRKLHAVRERQSGVVPLVELVHGNLAELDKARLQSADVLTLVEVVEHLDQPALAELGPALLGRCEPRALIVTTPNVEYNLNMMVRCSGGEKVCKSRGLALDAERLRREVQEGRLCKGCELFCKGVPPPLDRYKLRNEDHRFEWSRVEFRQWATELAEKFGYNVRFDGVGGGPFDEVKDPNDVFHGPGPSSQIAIFERLVDMNGDEDWSEF